MTYSGSVSEFDNNLILGTIWAGIGALSETAKLGYGYVTDPQNRENTAKNAKQFAQNFGKYTPNGREWFFNDLGNSKYRQNAETQSQQLDLAKSQRDPTGGRWNIRNQTGFDDERDNVIDDRARSRESYLQYKDKQPGVNNMAYDDNGNSSDTNRGNRNQRPFVNYSSRPSDYAPGEKLSSDLAGYQIKSLADLQNNTMQSRDRQYKTNVDAGVNYQLGSQKIQAYRDIGYRTSEDQLKASKYKTETEASTEKFKWNTVNSTEKYKWTTVNPTSVAEAQIKAGTYGLSESQLRKAASDKTNFDNWKNYNDSMFNYTNQMNAQMKLSQDIGQSQRAYNDQRNDRSNDQSLAIARYNADQAQKINDRNRYYNDLAEQRRLQRDDFNLRSRQIQSQIDIANKDYQIRYDDGKLRQNQFAATRADISYNRGNQSSSLAF